MSGGRSTIAAAKGKRLAAQAGDITCISPVGQWFTDRFFIECKHYARLNIDGLLTGKGHLAEFWAIAVEQAKKYDKLPMLIAKQNRLATIMCFDRRGMATLNAVLTPRLTAPPLNLYAVWFDEFVRLKP